MAADRGEWSRPIDRDVPLPPLLEATPQLAAVGQMIKGPLQLAFTTRIGRTARSVRLEGDTLVEAAFDIGDIEAGVVSEAISEMEIELKGGRIGPLYRFAAALQQAAPLCLMSESKASCAEGFSPLLGGALGRLTSNIGPTLCGDPAAVHQSRIVLREARIILHLFSRRLDPHEASRCTQTLGALEEDFGAARDWDVFCLQTRPAAMPDLSDQRMEDLNQAAEVERQRAHETVAIVIQGPLFS